MSDKIRKTAFDGPPYNYKSGLSKASGFHLPPNNFAGGKNQRDNSTNFAGAKLLGGALTSQIPFQTHNNTPHDKENKVKKNRRNWITVRYRTAWLGGKQGEGSDTRGSMLELPLGVGGNFFAWKKRPTGPQR